MTDDFTLFSTEAHADDDVALITAYLARELSPVQIAAVQDRLDMDDAFRESVRPIIEAWVLPGGLREGVARRTELRGPRGARTDIRRLRSDVREPSPSAAARSRRWARVARIAAVIAFIMVPMIAVAQVTVYLADHPGAFGHSLARRITTAIGRRPPVSPEPAVKQAPVAVLPMAPQPAATTGGPGDQRVGRSLPAGVRQSDTVVRRATAPVHPGVAGVRRETAIGVANGDEPYMLGAIADVAVSAAGDVYIWDRSVPAIRMYDAAGKFLRNIGRSGSGPGEYRSGAGIAVARNGNLLLWDPGNARINVYSPTGESVGTVATRSGTSGMMLGRDLLRVDTAGVMSIFTILVDRTRGGAGNGSGWIRFKPDGSLKDTLRQPDGPETKGLEAVAPSGGQFSSRSVPFSPVFQSALSPLGYLVTALNDRIAIDLHLPRQLVSIRRDAPAVAVTRAERDSARAEITADFRKLQPSWSWNGPDIPRTKPVFSDLLVDGQGRLWVQVGEGPRPANDTSTWQRGDIFFAEGRGTGPRPPAPAWSCPASGTSLFDVYEPTGRYLGQVRLPERADPVVMRGDLVWAATCNADDVPSVVRFRIEWRR